MEPVFIRDMKSEDVSEVAAIERASFSTPWSEQSFYGEVYGRHSISRIAFLEGRIAGYCIGRIILDEGHLFDLAVHPDFRNRGIGKLLLEDLIGGLALNDCKALYLEVRAGNEPARRVYAAMGFSHVGTRKNYYKNPVEDALLMMLKIGKKM